MVSPVYARKSGVSGSPWIALLNSFDVSGLFDKRCANGAARKLKPLPVVCVPPLRYLFGACRSFQASERYGLACFQRHFDRLPGRIAGLMTLTVCGTVSWIAPSTHGSCRSRRAPIGSLV